MIESKTNLYAITISPPYSPEHIKHLHCQYTYEIRRWCNKFSKHYMMYPEFDDETRLHYHGVIRVEDWIKFHKTRLTFQRTVGFVKIKPLTTFRRHLGWLMYCQKHTKECPCRPFYYQSLKKLKQLTYKEEVDLMNTLSYYFKAEAKLKPQRPMGLG